MPLQAWHRVPTPVPSAEDDRSAGTNPQKITDFAGQATAIDVEWVQPVVVRQTAATTDVLPPPRGFQATVTNGVHKINSPFLHSFLQAILAGGTAWTAAGYISCAAAAIAMPMQTINRISTQSPATPRPWSHPQAVPQSRTVGWGT